MDDETKAMKDGILLAILRSSFVAYNTGEAPFEKQNSQCLQSSTRLRKSVPQHLSLSNFSLAVSFSPRAKFACLPLCHTMTPLFHSKSSSHRKFTSCCTWSRRQGAIAIPPEFRLRRQPELLVNSADLRLRSPR